MKTRSRLPRVAPLAAASFLALGAASCQADTANIASATGPASQAASPGLRDRDIPLAKKLIAEGAVVLDVRTPGEFASGHLEEAKLIPVQELKARIAEVEQLAGGDKDKPIVVYCASGRRATTAKQMLLEAGFKNVMNAGGYSDLAR